MHDQIGTKPTAAGRAGQAEPSTYIPLWPNKQWEGTFISSSMKAPLAAFGWGRVRS